MHADTTKEGSSASTSELVTIKECSSILKRNFLQRIFQLDPLCKIILPYNCGSTWQTKQTAGRNTNRI